MKLMNENKKSLIKMIGDQKFEEEMNILDDMKKSDAKKSDFQAMEGDVDIRESYLKDKEVS